MNITLKNIDEFLTSKQLNNVFNSHNTVRSYRARLVSWHAFSATAGVDDIDTANLYLRSLVDAHGSKTVKSTLYVLKSFYSWLGGPENPFDQLSGQYRVNKKEAAIKKLDRDHRVYSRDEVDKLLVHAQGKLNPTNQSETDYYLAYRNWFIIFLLSEYGMRISGLVGVNVNHVKFETRCMTIYDSKNGEPYPVPLKSNLAAMRSYLAVRSRIIGAFPKASKALFLSKTGKRLSDTSARRAINDLAAEIGLYDAGRSTHQLRHYRATRYFNDGMALDLISIVMGVSVQVLKSTYLHLTESDTVKQYETWLDNPNRHGFTCPECGYSNIEQKIDYDKPNLRVV